MPQADSAMDARPTRPTVRFLHHVSFRVDDLGQSLDFYCGLLGCEQRPRPDQGFPGAWLQLGDVQIHLLEVAVDATTGFPPLRANPLANHVAFNVDDLEAFRSYVAGEGFEITNGPLPTIPQFFVQDPSGNTIEFTTNGR